MLRRRAQAGVSVYVLMYKVRGCARGTKWVDSDTLLPVIAQEVELALTMNSKYGCNGCLPCTVGRWRDSSHTRLFTRAQVF